MIRLLNYRKAILWNWHSIKHSIPPIQWELVFPKLCLSNKEKNLLAITLNSSPHNDLYIELFDQQKTKQTVYIVLSKTQSISHKQYKPLIRFRIDGSQYLRYEEINSI